MTLSFAIDTANPVSKRKIVNAVHALDTFMDLQSSTSRPRTKMASMTIWKALLRAVLIQILK